MVALKALYGRVLLLHRIGCLVGGCGSRLHLSLRSSGRGIGFDGRDDDLLKFLQGVSDVPTFEDVLWKIAILKQKKALASRTRKKKKLAQAHLFERLEDALSLPQLLDAQCYLVPSSFGHILRKKKGGGNLTSTQNYFKRIPLDQIKTRSRLLHLERGPNLPN